MIYRAKRSYPGSVEGLRYLQRQFLTHNHGKYFELKIQSCHLCQPHPTIQYRLSDQGVFFTALLMSMRAANSAMFFGQKGINGILTNSGSLRYLSRSAKACLVASTMMW